jgi:hypothetical protein
MAKKTKSKPHPDADIGKGATEDGDTANVSYTGQLPHRPRVEGITDADSDFPEPGGNPEHSGQRRAPKSEK